MEHVIERCAGLDVHKATVAACVRTPGTGRTRRQEVRTFGTNTADLLALRDWLYAHGVTLVRNHVKIPPQTSFKIPPS